MKLKTKIIPSSAQKMCLKNGHRGLGAAFGCSEIFSNRSEYGFKYWNRRDRRGAPRKNIMALKSRRFSAISAVKFHIFQYSVYPFIAWIRKLCPKNTMLQMCSTEILSCATAFCVTFIKIKGIKRLAFPSVSFLLLRTTHLQHCVFSQSFLLATDFHGWNTDY